MTLARGTCMSVLVTIDSGVQDLAVGLVEAIGVTIAAAGVDLMEECRQAVARARIEGPEGGDARRQAVRGLLRCGGFKPSGATSRHRSICCVWPASRASGP